MQLLRCHGPQAGALERRDLRRHFVPTLYDFPFILDQRSSIFIAPRRYRKIAGSESRRGTTRCTHARFGFNSFMAQILSCEDKNDAMIVDVDNLNEWAGFEGIADERMQMVIDSATNANETASQPVASKDTSDLGSPLSSSDELGEPVNLIPFRYAMSYFDRHENLIMPKNKV